MGVTVVTTRVAANTSTGTQDITSNDLGGLTPKAVLLIATRGVTDGTAADGAGFYIGASDGTNEWTQGYEDQHAQATINNAEEQDTTANRILTIYDGTAADVVEATANFDSFISDGVRIDWTDAPASAFLVTAIFFAGTDLSVHVGSQTLGNVADALIAVTSVGFEADVLITTLLEGTTTLNANVGLGLVHNNRAGTVTQRSAVHVMRDGFGSAQAGVQYRDGEGIARLIGSSQAIDFHGTFQSFDSSGFDVQMGNTRQPGNTHLGWLALRFGASAVVESKVYTYSTPTGTGSNTDSTPNFEPQFVLYLANRAAAADTSETDSDGGTFGVVVADADEVYTQSFSAEDGAADSNTQSLSDNAVNLPTHTGAAGHTATLTSMGSTGPVWSYSATDGTARLWPALAIEIFASGTTYESTVSGAITPAGALLKSTSKIVAGANTPAGALSKQTSKTMSGANTPAGALVKEAAKLFSGTLTSDGALARLTAKLFAGTLTSEGVLTQVRTFLVNVAGTLTSAGALIRDTAKSLAGTLTSAGTTNRATSLSASGSITPTGGIIKSISKSLSGALSSIVGALTSLLQQPNTGVVRNWTLHDRDLAWSLADRDTAFSLRDRDLAWELEARDLEWSLRDRDTTWTIDER